MSDNYQKGIDILKQMTDDEGLKTIKYLQDIFPDFEDKIGAFLKNYEIFAKDAVDSFVYAETIADYMMLVFDASNSNQTKRKVLEIAMEAAIWANRFAAMDTCVSKIHSISDENIGRLVAPLIQSYEDSFLKKNLNVSECQSNAVRIAVRAIQGK